MSIEKEFEEVFMRFVDESPRKALSTITGHFVGLTLALIEVDGHEVEGDIFIDSCGGRDITIHAPKEETDA